MSGITNKIKDTLQGDKTHHQPQGAYGTTHGTNTIDPTAPRTTATHGQPGAFNTTGTAGVPAGGETGGNYSYGTSGPAPTTDGPHKSDMMNKVDPRVDSDRDYSKNMGLNPHGTADTGGITRTAGAGAGAGGTHTAPLSGTHQAAAPIGGTTGTTGGLTGSHNTTMPSSATAGHGTTGGLTGTTGHATTGAGLTGSHQTTGVTGSGVPEGAFGPHSTRVANAADPRIDSDLDNRRNVGTAGHGTTGAGLTGAHHTPGTTGQHTTGHPAGTATGPAPHTAGPHKSDMMNKIDPRVDSDLDGSKTIGGNKTFAGSNVGSTHTTH